MLGSYYDTAGFNLHIHYLENIKFDVPFDESTSYDIDFMDCINNEIETDEVVPIELKNRLRKI